MLPQPQIYVTYGFVQKRPDFVIDLSKMINKVAKLPNLATVFRENWIIFHQF